MLYYRRKIILALFQLSEGHLTAKRFQKLLFLFTRMQPNKCFDFIPYKYGCFSFQANQDIITLTTYGMLRINDTDDGRYVELVKGDNYLSLLKEDDLLLLKKTLQKFGSLSQTELIRYTYQNYPYYAINSSIASSLLSDEELSNVNKQKRATSEQMLFTIGYEGLSLETYINTLIYNNIKVLCDVRKNAFSQKYGFSKKQLSTACKGVGIEYIHIPELGIESSQRQELHSQTDYDTLFAAYCANTLVHRQNELSQLLSLLMVHKRIALTCFEKDPIQCHRNRIAERLVALADAKLELNNL